MSPNGRKCSSVTVTIRDHRVVPFNETGGCGGNPAVDLERDQGSGPDASVLETSGWAHTLPHPEVRIRMTTTVIRDAPKAVDGLFCRGQQEIVDAGAVRFLVGLVARLRRAVHD